MTFPTQSSLHGTIKQLKDIVLRMQREDREAIRLVKKMEVLVLRMERKVRQTTKVKYGPLQPATAATLPAVNSAAALDSSDTIGATI